MNHIRVNHTGSPAPSGSNDYNCTGWWFMDDQDDNAIPVGQYQAMIKSGLTF